MRPGISFKRYLSLFGAALAVISNIREVSARIDAPSDITGNGQTSSKTASAHDDGKSSVFLNMSFLTNAPYLEDCSLLL